MDGFSFGRFRLFFCLLLGALTLVPFAYGDSELPETADGLLVLRNGNVIEGRVTRLAEYFRVELEHGQLQVRVDQVEMFCETLDEAYHRRREMRVGSMVDSHVELAAWCLRHELLEFASHELFEARAVDPHHRKLSRLERQLNQALQREIKSPKLPMKQVVASVEQADTSAIKQAPRWARVLFVRKIQPILAKSCATGCHQPDSSRQWQLNRLATDGAGHPEATKLNLASVLKQIEFQNAADSPLLRFAHTTHASGASKPLPAYQLQMFRAWVEQLAMADTSTSATAQQTAESPTEKSSMARLADRYRHNSEFNGTRVEQPQADGPIFLE